MAVTIYRTSDRIPIKIDELEFKISPLQFKHKMEIISKMRVNNGQVVDVGLESTYLSVKYAVKEVKGLVTMDGGDYELEFDEDGNLTDDCVQELLNLEMGAKIVRVCRDFIENVPEVIIDPSTGEPMEGVEIVSGK